MSEHEAFLQGILQAPDDDAPRQVYADWLEERNDPRGEFIRVQCELAKIPIDDPRWDALEQRQWDLLCANEEKWTADIKSLVTEWQFHRGFVDTVSMGARAFVDIAAKLFSRAPIRNVKLTRVGRSGISTAQELGGCPEVGRLRSLALDCRPQGDSHQWPHSFPFTQLRALSLWGQEFGYDEFLQGVVNRLPSLEELNLIDVIGFCNELVFLKDPKTPLRLKKLDLSFSAPIPVNIGKVTSAPGLGTLTHLNLANNQFRVAGGQALAASPHLTNLVSLGLEGCTIGVKGTQALANAALLANLTSINLQNNNIPDGGVQAIISSPHWTKLRELYLGMNNIGAKGITSLVGWPGLDRLNLLHLWLNKSIGEEGAQLLAESPRVANLLHLDLGYTTLTAKGLVMLGKSPHLTRLRHLNIEGNKVGDAGIQLLAKSPILAGLRVLNLARTEMKDAGARAIIDSSHLTHMRQLKLNGNKLKATTREALETRFRPSVCQFGQV